MLSGLNVALAAAVPLRAALAAPDVSLTPRQVRVLGLVLEHLLPAGPDSPGAREVNAIGYVLGVLAHPQTADEERQFVRDGVRWLEEVPPPLPFEALDAAQREAKLHGLAATGRGENWLSSLLGYGFEALFGDPVYGGNPDGIGWRWIEHRPGFPRPTADKIYGRL